MNDPDQLLHRLATAARKEAPCAPADLPLGLATRVLARLREQPAPSIWESFSLAALPVAALVTLACVWLGSPTPEQPDDAELISNLMLETQLPTLPEP
jgi:hypothetical protein